MLRSPKGRKHMRETLIFGILGPAPPAPYLVTLSRIPPQLRGEVALLLETSRCFSWGVLRLLSDLGAAPMAVSFSLIYGSIGDICFSFGRCWHPGAPSNALGSLGDALGSLVLECLCYHTPSPTQRYQKASTPSLEASRKSSEMNMRT